MRFHVTLINAKFASHVSARNYGATDWIRTNDLRFTKPLLYQLSYGGDQGEAGSL